MYRSKALTTAMAVLLFLANASARSATIAILDSIDDFEAQRRSDTGVYIASENNITARAGHQTNFNGSGANAPGAIMPIYFFLLPTLAAGESVTSASFSLGVVPDTATSAVTPTFNGDLYILGLIDAIAKTAADAQKFWYIGNTAQAALPTVGGSSTVNATVSRVADNFLLPADFVPNGGTEVLHSSDISAYVQNLYASPGPTGFTPGTSYLVVRVNPDADSPPTTGTQRYSLATQGTPSNFGSGTNRPTVTLEVIPEPSSLALTLLFAAGTIRLRSRRSHAKGAN
jgi:hypothetical protein